MKSAKQRRAEIAAKRKKRAAKRETSLDAVAPQPAPYRMIPVNENLLAPNNSYGAPEFVSRGYYVDIPFCCVACGKQEVWTGSQQKWWYEVAKGFVYSTAVRCRPCRRKERMRRAGARRIHLEGMARKTK
jgi:putative zinc ribbon protein